MHLNRRTALTLLGSGTALNVPAVALGQSKTPGQVTFAHGIASGDPAADGAIIWTRVTVEDGFTGDVELKWHVAPYPGTEAVSSGSVMARASADHTAKVDVGGLEAGGEYHYWFEGPGGARTELGRFRTLPTGKTDDAVLAVASCQLYPGGFYNAFADMAKLERLDAVIHLGDYIYEYGDTGYGTDIGRQIGRLPVPTHEIVSLADYRQRHAQVKADPHMQAAHARAPFICVWDDHETTNNSWIGGAQNHQNDTEGDWSARKAVAMQAYFEWMPIRDPDPLRAHEAIFRSFEFGDLATLAMVETRLLARDQEVLPRSDLTPEASSAAVLAERDQPHRELLGREQSDWLEAVMSASVAAGKPWQLLGNQVIMAKVPGPDLEAILGADAFAAMRAAMPELYRNRLDEALVRYRAGVPFSLDSWDGYPHARERLYSLFARAGSRPIVLSGDSHAAWSNNLHDDGGRLAAVEAGCTAISSPSFGSIMPGIGVMLQKTADEVAFCDQDSKGYSIVTLTPGEARVDHVTVSTVVSDQFDRGVSGSFAVSAGFDGGPWRSA
ncbi:alkaline phosphatase D family protein [Erythrobacter sp. MTPC3]|uniref:alkaline phosphatase D family protein n=1 Tax=Erythrobacter sp. MTPC3 TaxID=3056564 RepID=UPI0036F4449B